MARIWKKTPNDVEAYTVTWRGADPNVEYALDDAESIVTSTWVLPSGITEDSSSNIATAATIFIAGAVSITANYGTLTLTG